MDPRRRLARDRDVHGRHGDTGRGKRLVSRLLHQRSTSAFGLLSPQALSSRRADTGRTLAEHIGGLGGRPEALARGEAELRPESIDCSVGLHLSTRDRSRKEAATPSAW